MKSEFKIIKGRISTVYVLEDATGGSTSAGSIASVSAPLGEIRKREQVKVTVPQKPRLGPPKPQTGAGGHQDKRKKVKHKGRQYDGFDEGSHECPKDKTCKICNKAKTVKEGVDHQKLGYLLYTQLLKKVPDAPTKYGDEVVGDAIVNVANRYADMSRLRMDEINVMVDEIINDLEAGTFKFDEYAVKLQTMLENQLELDEKAPPGWSEDEMMKLKNKYGKNRAFAVAWAAYKKAHPEWKSKKERAKK